MNRKPTASLMTRRKLAGALLVPAAGGWATAQPAGDSMPDREAHERLLADRKELERVALPQQNEPALVYKP